MKYLIGVLTNNLKWTQVFTSVEIKTPENVFLSFQQIDFTKITEEFSKSFDVFLIDADSISLDQIKKLKSLVNAPKLICYGSSQSLKEIEFKIVDTCLKNSPTFMKDLEHCLFNSLKITQTIPVITMSVNGIASVKEPRILTFSEDLNILFDDAVPKSTFLKLLSSMITTNCENIVSNIINFFDILKIEDLKNIESQQGSVQLLFSDLTISQFIISNDGKTIESTNLKSENVESDVVYIPTLDFITMYTHQQREQIRVWDKVLIPFSKNKNLRLHSLSNKWIDKIQKLIGGKIVYNQLNQLVFNSTNGSQINVNLLSERQKRLGTIARIFENGYLSTGYLIWDTPELGLSSDVELLAELIADLSSQIQVIIGTNNDSLCTALQELVAERSISSDRFNLTTIG